MDIRTEDNCRLWTATTGQGKPLFMRHGGPGLGDMAGSLADRLASRLEVIRWDQRGCGRPRWAVDSLERALPDVRRVVLPGAGHIPWLEKPGEFAGHLLGFLNQ